MGTSFGSAIVLLGTIPWALPGTADRGVAAGLVLAIILAIAVMTKAPPARDVAGTASSAWPPQRIAALVIGAQILARSGELLAPTTRDVVSIVAWAAVAAIAIVLLALQRGLFVAALAGAAAFTLGPGFTMTTAFALAAPALAALVADERRPLPLRAVCAATLLVPLVSDLVLGAFVVLGAIAVAGARWMRWAAGLAALIAFFAGGADRLAGLRGTAWLLVLLPIVLSELIAETSRWRFGAAKAATRFAALGLGLAIAAQLDDLSALSIPAVLLAMTLGGAQPLARATQTAWIGVLAFAVAVLAAYPWLREDALVDAAAVLALGQSWRAALVTVLLVASAAIAAILAESRRGASAAPRLVPFALFALLGVVALLAHPAVEATPIAHQPIELVAGSPAWSLVLRDPARVRTVVLHSSLSHAAATAPGTVIAEVRLATAGGDVVVPVRAGIDTGEWAARRADVAAQPGFTAPVPYLHWVDAGRGFFGQRYRSRTRLDQPVTATAVAVRLTPDVTSDVVLTLFHLELAR
jgi:hypothetical protein